MEALLPLYFFDLILTSLLLLLLPLQKTLVLLLLTFGLLLLEALL